jgi:hypothetical protein
MPEYFNDERLIQSGRNLILTPLAESLVESVSDLASSVRKCSRWLSLNSGRTCNEPLQIMSVCHWMYGEAAKSNHATLALTYKIN